jgi:hypothetical protein
MKDNINRWWLKAFKTKTPQPSASILGFKGTILRDKICCQRAHSKYSTSFWCARFINE